LNYIKCYNRNRVSVPSFDENITVNNKTINVVVGNFTNPINLTYGERTESCMRSGGDGDSLYNYCLNNDNGFHIRFTDPKTGEFISRISGFRNGNTVFLNQLRNSVLDNYDINDLLEICKKTSKEIIERSKNSEFPIDNVVVSYDKEKMEKYGVIPTDLNVSKTSITENQNIWFDLSPKTAVVLSSSNEDNTLVPIKLGLDKISYYPVIRDKIKISLNSNEGINHIEAVEQMLSGKRLDDISLPNNEYDVCYYGEDWYVAITKDGNIVKKIMSKSKDYESAFEEMSVALNNIENVEKIFNETSYKK
jgi:translation elongation factor EF-1beta